MVFMLGRRMLIELAERKLGEGATIRITHDGWAAERTIKTEYTVERTQVICDTRWALECRLRQMPDRTNQPSKKNESELAG